MGRYICDAVGTCHEEVDSAVDAGDQLTEIENALEAQAESNLGRTLAFMSIDWIGRAARGYTPPVLAAIAILYALPVAFYMRTDKSTEEKKYVAELALAERTESALVRVSIFSLLDVMWTEGYDANGIGMLITEVLFVIAAFSYN